LVDVGSRWGRQRPWDQYPDDYVNYFGFDADARECERLNKINKHKNYKFIPAALSDGNRTETLYITRESGRSSIFKPNYNCLNKYYDKEGFEVLNKVEVYTTTLNKIIEDNKIDPDFLKIDTQGSELNIIKGVNNYYERILGFEIEVEFIQTYEGQPLFGEVDEFMRSIGFELYDLNRYWAKRSNMELKYSNRGQVVFADAIYFRNLSSFFLSKYANEKDLKNKLIKMINILILYGYHDVANEFLCHRQSPLSKNEKDIIQKLLHDISAYPTWQRILFNNRVAQRFGVLLHCLGNLFSYRAKTSGWGTDYETVNGRYAYHAPKSIVRLFGRK